MNPKYELYEQIDRYLNNSMSPTEHSGFVELLQKDEELRETVEAQRLANDLVLDEELIHLKSRMQQEMGGNGNAGLSGRTKIVLASLVALILATATYLFLNSDSSSTSASTSKENTTPVSENKNTTTAATSVDAENTIQNNSKRPVVLSKSSDSVSEDIQKKNNTVNTESNTISEKAEKISIATEESEKDFVTVKTPAVKCDEVKLDAQTRIIYENNNTEATIVVDSKSIQGGKAPYQFSLDKENFSSETRFESIQEGSYHLFIKDQDQCVVELPKTIVVKFPEKEINDAFSPDNGDRWTFPMKGNADANIVIQNKSGQIVYSKKIQGGQPAEWDGRDNNGTDLSSGNYYFIITFTNATIQTGHISIFR